MNSENSIQIATFGNGCFWCTEAIFSQLNGVLKAVSGYSGGSTLNPDYKTVCAGSTGHAECIQIEYDDSIISFEDLLEIFFNTHNPTTLNRQGEDVGTQYRSVVFYRTVDEKQITESYINQLNTSGIFSNPIVTTLEPFHEFYPAEDYHQNYLSLNGHNPYCQLVVRPKVEKFKKTYAAKLKNG